MATKYTLNQPYSLVRGDIFYHTSNRIAAGIHGSHVIIPHVCNNVNAFGAGFAADVAEKFPEVKANFHMLGKTAKLGTVQFITVKKDPQYKHSIIVANMIAQNKLMSEKNPRPLNYAALTYCMNQVRSYASEIMKQPESNRVEIHAPKFGSGLAGGNWNFICELMKDLWYDTDIFIYIK